MENPRKLNESCRNILIETLINENLLYAPSQENFPDVAGVTFDNVNWLSFDDECWGKIQSVENVVFVFNYEFGFVINFNDDQRIKYVSWSWWMQLTTTWMPAMGNVFIAGSSFGE